MELKFPNYDTRHREKSSFETGHSGTFRDMDDPSTLTDSQLRAIELTVQGLNDTHVAEMISVDRKTIWRWKTFNEEYRQMLASAREHLHGTAGDRCQNLLFRATAVLAKFLEDDSDKNRIRAAQILIQSAARFRPTALPPQRPTRPPRRAKIATPIEVDDGPPLLEPKVG